MTTGVELLHPATTAVADGPNPSGLLPPLSAAAYTLAYSVRVLALSLTREIPKAQGDELIGGWAERMQHLARMHVRVEGGDRLDRNKTYVLMSNHRSHYDIPALFLAAPFPLRMVAKQELRRVPLFGLAAESLGFVYVDRRNRARAIEQLRAAREGLLTGTSLWVAAEGKRSPDNAMLPFKMGGFHVARGLGVPVVPVWIEGTERVMAPGQVLFGLDCEATVRFGTPIPTEGRADEPIRRLAREVRDAMVALSGRPDDHPEDCRV